MANSDKNILITPNRGLSGQPQIALTGAGNSAVNIKVDDGSIPKLNFESGSQTIFSLDSANSSSLFNIVDENSVPIFQTESDRVLNFNSTTKFDSVGPIQLKDTTITPPLNNGSIYYDISSKHIRVGNENGIWTECYDKGIVRNGLVLYFDVTNYECYPRSGTSVFDLSGTGNNGTSDTGVSYSENDGGYFSFDGGTNSYITVNNSSSLSLAYDKTICCWFYMGADSNGAGIAGKGGSTGNGMHLAYGWNTNGFMNINWNSSNTPVLTKAGARDLTKWVYLVGMVYQDVRYIFVVDTFGVRTATASGSAGWNNGVAFRIGSAGDAGSRAPSGSRFKSIQVYNRALSIQEIHRNYQYERLKFNYH